MGRINKRYNYIFGMELDSYFWIDRYGNLPIEAKVMFLSPMNSQERMRYIQISFWVRILAPTLIGILIGICFLVIGSAKNYVVILSLVNLLSCLIFCAIEPGFNRNNKMRKNVKENVFSLVGMILSLSIELGLIFWENWLGQARNIYHISIGVALVIVGIMLGIYLMRLPKRLEVYSIYEEYML